MLPAIEEVVKWYSLQGTLLASLCSSLPSVPSVPSALSCSLAPRPAAGGVRCFF